MERGTEIQNKTWANFHQTDFNFNQQNVVDGANEIWKNKIGDGFKLSFDRFGYLNLKFVNALEVIGVKSANYNACGFPEKSEITRKGKSCF